MKTRENANTDIFAVKDFLPSNLPIQLKANEGDCTDLIAFRSVSVLDINHKRGTQAVTQTLAVLLGTQADNRTVYSEFKIYGY